MPRTILSNAIILEGDNLEPTAGTVIIRDEVIDRVDTKTLSGGTDLKRSIIMPPLVNAHIHILDSVAKERYLGKKLYEVVGKGGEKFKAIENSTAEQITEAVSSTMRDMLATGTLAHCDFRERGTAGLKLLESLSSKLPISLRLGRPVRNGDMADVLKLADGIGLSSHRDYSGPELRKIAGEVHRRKKILALHVAEDGPCTERELKNVMELRPTFLVHGTHLTDPQISELSKAGIPLVFCHRANHVLGAGTPPLKKAMESGLKFFLGTDNTMVCQPDMFSEISFVWAHMRLSDPSCDSNDAAVLLKSATLEPAMFFGLPWGPIKEGGRATFIVLARGNNLRNVSDLHAGIVNRARADNVRGVYFNGRAV